MVSFLTNFILGFVLAAEFGPVSLEVARRGLSKGFKQAMLVNLGATLSDWVYLTLSIAGILFFLDNDSFLKWLWLIGSFVLFYIGLTSIFKSFDEKIDFSFKKEKRGAFFQGFLLNFVHPLNLVWWITLLSPLILSNSLICTRMFAYLNGMGIVFGVFSWWLILSTLAYFGKRFMNFNLLKFISLFSSLILIGFSFWFLYNAYLIF